MTNETIRMPTEDGEIVYSKDGLASIEFKDGTYIFSAEQGSSFFDPLKNMNMSRVSNEGGDQIEITVSGDIEFSPTDYVFNPNQGE